jgi:phosphopantothenoylcysteine decarboxylase / phosphopantothenate---cysteine ligase
MLVAGFAAETDEVIQRAIDKLQQKNLDMIIANDVSNDRMIDKTHGQVTIITKDLQQYDSLYTDKHALALFILQHVSRQFCAKKTP